MSILLIFMKLWKYKFVTLPIVACVAAGAFYVIAVKAPTYEASATYILVAPPAPPTDTQIARDPALGRLNSDNPYTRFSDQSVLVQVLASRLSSADARLALAQRGADPRYTAEPSAAFGFSSPILQVTGTGSTAAAAVTTAKLVGRALTDELDQMQRLRGVDKGYWITTQAVVPAHGAKLKPSGKLRALVAVLVLGMVVLFIAVSVLDAVSALRGEWVWGPAADGAVESEADVAPPVRLHPSASTRGSVDTHAQHSHPGSGRDPQAPQWPRDAQV